MVSSKQLQYTIVPDSAKELLGLRNLIGGVFFLDQNKDKDELLRRLEALERLDSMKTYTYSQARQKLAFILEESKKEKVLIRRRGYVRYCSQSLAPPFAF
jgi:hypothetical protein